MTDHDPRYDDKLMPCGCIWHHYGCSMPTTLDRCARHLASYIGGPER